MKKLIKEFTEYQKTKGQKASSTIKNYQHYLTAFQEFAGDPRPEQITLDLIDSFQKHLIEKGASLSTQSYYLIALRIFLKWLRTRKDIACLDPEKIELPKNGRKILDPLSEKETKALLKVPDCHTKEGIRARAILELLLSSGIRVGELCKLKVTDIDFETRRFIVNGKGNKDRQCFLTPEAVIHIKKYLESRSNGSDYLITSYADRGHDLITSRSIQRLVGECAKQAGIKKKVTPHTLRRTFATHLLRSNVDIRYIKDFLGHSNLQTTDFYTKTTGVELEKVYKTANSSMVNKVPGGVKNEFMVLAKTDYYKLIGQIGKNRELLIKICHKLEIK